MKKLSEVINQYRQEHHAIPAFNIDTFEIFQAIEAAVKETNLPCIVQLSAGEDAFIEAERLFLLVQKSRLNDLPIYLNMDHGNNISRLKQTLKLGFDMVHFDGSKLDLALNQLLAKDLVEYAHYFHSLVEVEFDAIHLVDNHDATVFTDPQTAKKFVDTTRPDFFAVSIGNKHGAIDNQPEYINLELLKTIATTLPDTYLTLHGGSGIDPHQVQQAIASGIVKININTDLRHAFRRSLNQAVTTINSEKAYELMAPVVAAVKEVAKNKLLDFQALKL